MQRWAKPSLASLALLAAAACPRPRGAPQPPPRAAGEPELRIGLALGLGNASIGGPESGELFVSEAASGTPVGSVPAGVRWVVFPDSADPSRLRLVKPDSTRTEPLRGVAVVNVTENRFVVANGRRYRGRINITSSRAGGGLTVVNRINVEGYIAGVVAPEIGARRPDEVAAVLAQAVVSRSFAIKNRGRWEAFGFDAYADTRDQVYLGVAVETDQVWDAVRATAGQVLTYDGDVIDAYFHSACGFSTAGLEEAFATVRSRPYLRPVSDDRGDGGGHYYCDIAPRFRWREEWDGSKLRTILSRTLPTVTPLSGDGLQRITDVTVSRTTRSGRVGELRIVFERGDIRIPGPDVRSVLRPETDRTLSSTAFQLTVTRTNGEVTRLVAAGAGSGHAVGMCQWGAIGRARAGQDYRAILTTYFPGTKIERRY
ncbi:MAG TPA: SpoIID/LytB domain-containing protein [Gemmatimonadales bacterium]|nr:SpoIID/LytB domain-containing protein [Gemmatimonadales bacterium]